MESFMVWFRVTVVLPILTTYVLAGSSCQTVQGMGKDLNNLGKAVLPSKKGVIEEGKEHKEQSTAVFAQGGAWKEAKTHEDVPNKGDKLRPKLAKEGLVWPKEDAQPLVLKDLPAKTDIQEIPSSQGKWEGAEAVDLDADGLPDVRYRQREY